MSVPSHITPLLAAATPASTTITLPLTPTITWFEPADPDAREDLRRFWASVEARMSEKNYKRFRRWWHRLMHPGSGPVKIARDDLGIPRMWWSDLRGELKAPEVWKGWDNAPSAKELRLFEDRWKSLGSTLQAAYRSGPVRSEWNQACLHQHFDCHLPLLFSVYKDHSISLPFALEQMQQSSTRMRTAREAVISAVWHDYLEPKSRELQQLSTSFSQAGLLGIFMAGLLASIIQIMLASPHAPTSFDLSATYTALFFEIDAAILAVAGIIIFALIQSQQQVNPTLRMGRAWRTTSDRRLCYATWVVTG